MTKEKILIALDGSDHSLRALTWYAEHMDKGDHELLFAQVVEPPPSHLSSRGVGAQLHGAFARQAKEEAQRLASAVQDRCLSLGIQASLRFVQKFANQAGPALVELADEENVTLIVMSNRGLGTIKRTFLGSVSDYVLHNAKKPMFIIPPKK